MTGVKSVWGSTQAQKDRDERLAERTSDGGGVKDIIKHKSKVVEVV